MFRPQFSLTTLLSFTAAVGLFLGISLPLVETGRLMWANWQVLHAENAKQAEVEQMFREKDEWVRKTAEQARDTE